MEEFQNIFPRPHFIIIFRPEMLKFHPYSILTGDTRVEFVIYILCVKGVLPDPVNCKCFYICNQVHEAVHECCNREELFDPKILNCNWAYAVDCGDRPLPGETTTRKTTPTTVIYFL